MARTPDAGPSVDSTRSDQAASPRAAPTGSSGTLPPSKSRSRTNDAVINRPAMPASMSVDERRERELQRCRGDGMTPQAGEARLRLSHGGFEQRRLGGGQPL